MNEQTIKYWVIGLLTFLLLVWLMSLFSKFSDNKQAELEQQNDQLESQIELKQRQLSIIQEQIKSNTINRKISLTNAQIHVLDIYERSNIRIPADILEDMSQMCFKDEKHIQAFIESQRLAWKLENAKKPFKE